MNEVQRWKRATFALAALLVAMFICIFAAFIGGVIGYAVGWESSRNATYIPPAEMWEPEMAPPHWEEMTGPPWLGVIYETEANGARIVDVVPDSPAEEAGLRPDDLITRVDGIAIGAGWSLRNALALYDPGDWVTLTVERDGRTLEIDVRLGVRPPQFGPYEAPGPEPHHPPFHHDD